MKTLHMYIIISLLFISCFSENVNEMDIIEEGFNDSDAFNQNQHYTFDTILSNEYYLSYNVSFDQSFDQKMQSLTLMHNKVEVKKLNSCSYGLPYKNLGYLIHDFDTLFLLGYSFGSGNPHVIELINKSNGDVSLSAFYTDLKDNILLYNTFEQDSLPPELRVLDLKTNLDIIIKDFDNYNYAYDEDYFANGKKIDSVSDHNYWLSFESMKGKIIKKYNR